MFPVFYQCKGKGEQNLRAYHNRHISFILHEWPELDGFLFNGELINSYKTSFFCQNHKLVEQLVNSLPSAIKDGLNASMANSKL